MENLSRKRKRKSFVQAVKKKFKQNSRILGTRLDADVHEYFLRVFQQSKQEFSDVEERALFIDNVFSQTEGHEIEYSSNQLVSRIIENLLVECSENVLQRYLSVFGKDLRPLCSHQFASHVLETLLRLSSIKVYKLLNRTDVNSSNSEFINNSSDNDVSIYFNFVLKVSRFLLNNLDEFLLDVYANHITRTAILCLCGNVEESIKNSKGPLKSLKQPNVLLNEIPKKEDHPSEFKSLLLQFADSILNSHMFSEYANNVLMSGLVQSVLSSLHLVGNKSYLKRITLKLVNTIYCQDDKDFDIVNVLTNPGVHLLNSMLITSSNKIYEEIRNKCFSGRLKDMAVSKTANYSVQKLIENCRIDESFNAIYDELRDGFQQIIQSGFTGILFSISKKCHCLHTKEKTFVRDMMTTLEHCESNCEKVEGTNFIIKLLTLNNYREQVSTESNNFAIHLHGCLILQEMLKFKKPDKVVKSFLEIDSAKFMKILCDQKGSHIADVFFGNEMKNDKFRMRFIEKLTGFYVNLATDKYGSFVLTSFWKVANADQKLVIVEELISKESLIWSNTISKIVAKTVNLETYKHQPKEWLKAQKQLISSRQLFSDVI